MLTLLTEPKKRSRDFIYLVHGIMPWNSDKIDKARVKRRIEKIKSNDKFYSCSLIASLDKNHSQKFLGYDKPIKKLATFGNSGFIVKPASKDLVCIAHNDDLGSPTGYELQEFVEENRGKILSPLELLANEPYNYNEVIVQGNKGTVIQAVFYTDYGPCKEEAETIAKYVQELEGLKLPLVPVPY